MTLKLIRTKVSARLRWPIPEYNVSRENKTNFTEISIVALYDCFS